MSEKAFKQYLSIYAEPEVHTISGLKHGYEYAIAIPLCNEPQECLQSIFSNIKDRHVLLVVVVNSPESQTAWQKNNAEFIQNLQDKATQIVQLSENCSYMQSTGFNDVLLVDRNAPNRQINSKQGVGLARKIACDIILQLFYTGLIKSPWIFSTDADVILPKDYFSCMDGINNQYSAVVLDFIHITEDDYLSHLQYCYDFKLRYYLAGVQYARLGYSYIPLGSTLIINALCYAQVRGFPKRNAGEDFYLLNKLAKMRPVNYQPDCLPVVRIKSRFSDRVPFGTGPALLALSRLQEGQSYRYYHPKCFVLLKQWQVYLLACWSEDCLKIQAPENPELRALYNYWKFKRVVSQCQSQVTSSKRWSQFVHQWFDAFKVLKTVHYFDKYYSRLNYEQLLKAQEFAKVLNPTLSRFIKHNDKI